MPQTPLTLSPTLTPTLTRARSRTLGANDSRPVDSFFEALQDVDADRVSWLEKNNDPNPNPTPNPTPTPNPNPNEVLWYESLYLGFGFVWTYFFFAAIGTTTISGCVVHYYFMDEDTP